MKRYNCHWLHVTFRYGFCYGGGLATGFGLYLLFMVLGLWQDDILFYRGIKIIILSQLILFLILWQLGGWGQRHIKQHLSLATAPRRHAPPNTLASQSRFSITGRWRTLMAHNQSRLTSFFLSSLAPLLAPLRHQAFAIAFAGLCLNLSFHTLVPTTLDRAVSIFLLGYTANQQRPLSHDDLLAGFIHLYVHDGDAITRRMAEQIKSGMMTQTADGLITLAPRGHNFITLSRFLVKIFKLDDRFVNPKE